MKTYEYSCNHCSYTIETSGPWPYFGKENRKLCREGQISQPIQGLIADVYCPVCDSQKKYVIVQYKTPLTSTDDIWLQTTPRKTNMTCRKCKNPVFLILPQGKATCPRCKEGIFEPYDDEEEQDYRVSIVLPPKGPLKVRQDGKSIPIPKPTVIIDSAEYMGYTFGRFTN